MNESQLIVWDKKYEVGVGSIDTEHRILFMGFNTFVTARAKSDGSASVGYAVAFLEEYLGYHFRNEEALMRQVNYDRFELHQSEHRVLMRGLENIKQRSQQGREIEDDIFNLFRDWIVSHVVEEDRDIGAFLRCKARFYAQCTEEAENSDQEDVPKTFIERRNTVYCITNKNGRVYKRYAVNIPGIAIDHQGNRFDVTVVNLSQGGARLTGTRKLFKEAVGSLILPTTSLPELQFIVLDVKATVIGVCFTLKSDTQMLLARELMSPAFLATQHDANSPGPIDAEEHDGEFDGGEQGGGPDGLVSFGEL